MLSGRQCRIKTNTETHRDRDAFLFLLAPEWTKLPFQSLKCEGEVALHWPGSFQLTQSCLFPFNVHVYILAACSHTYEARTLWPCTHIAMRRSGP